MVTRECSIGRRCSIGFGFVLFAMTSILSAQPGTLNQDRFSSWYKYQLIPNLLFHTAPAGTMVGVEWEAAPLLYSWGINRKTSPWYSFIVVPTARFSGSIEWNVALQAYTEKVGRSHFGYSTHLMTYWPLSDVGELAGLNLGIGAYGSPDGFRIFKAIGVSTAFGMLHLNVRHAGRPTTWLTSLEVRLF